MEFHAIARQALRGLIPTMRGGVVTTFANIKWIHRSPFRSVHARDKRKMPTAINTTSSIFISPFPL